MFISADEAFSDVHTTTVGVRDCVNGHNIYTHHVCLSLQMLNQYRGYSSFKFLPGSQDKIVLAIKSEEIKGKIASCILTYVSN